jgi:polysaccharide pyruvyl transferase WcaK-like protein
MSATTWLRGTGAQPAGSPRAPNVLLLGGFGVGNLGNDASMQAAIQLVRRACPEAPITVVCPREDVVRSRYGVEAVGVRAPRPDARPRSGLGRVLAVGHRLQDVRHAVRVTSGCDLLLVPGTGILDDYGSERPTGWPLTLLVWFAAARLHRARTALVSIGAGPLDHPVSRLLARWVVTLAHHRSFRDPGSLAFAARTGARVEERDQVPDIAFSLPSPPVRAAASSSVVAVAVMRYRGWHVRQRTSGIGQRYVEDLADLCSWLLTEGHAVLLVTADEGDGAATQEVAEKVRSVCPELAAGRLSTATAATLTELTDVLCSVRAVVATRYHSVVAALLCGRPTVSLGYASKNDELMASVGLADYCQHAERIDQARLRDGLRRLLADEDRVARQVTDRVRDLRARLLEQELRLRELLAPGVRSEAGGR